jgi:hypothetical protein
MQEQTIFCLDVISNSEGLLFLIYARTLYIFSNICTHFTINISRTTVQHMCNWKGIQILTIHLISKVLLFFIHPVECVENVVLLLAVTVCLQGLRVHKSTILHGVTNIFNIYSNICTYRLLLSVTNFQWSESTTFIVFSGVTCNVSIIIVNYCKMQSRRKAILTIFSSDLRFALSIDPRILGRAKRRYFFRLPTIQI